MSIIGFARRTRRFLPASRDDRRTFRRSGQDESGRAHCTVPDLDTLRTTLATEATADAMKFDGVQSQTMVMLIES